MALEDASDQFLALTTLSLGKTPPAPDQKRIALAAGADLDTSEVMKNLTMWNQSLCCPA
jgi:hypothetical protein